MKNLKYFISIHMSKNTNIYTACWIYLQTHSFKKYAKTNTTWKKSFFPKVFSKHVHDHFIDLPPILEKKEKKENKYKVEKHHIYTTQWHQYSPSLILKKNTYTTILLEDCTIKQGKIKLKFQENQKITRKLERKSLNWKRVSLRWLWIKRDWNLREKI